MYDKKLVGERIRDERRKRDMRREDLAEVMNVSFETIKGMEQGRTITLDNIVAVAEIFGASLDYLLLGKVDNDVDVMLSMIPESSRMVARSVVKGALGAFLNEM